MPRSERLVAGALALATAAILTLAALVLVELDRESSLNHEVITQIELNDELEALRTELNALAHAARVAALTGTQEAGREIERRSQAIDARLAGLSVHRLRDNVVGFDALSRSARLLALNARSITRTRQERGREAAEAGAIEAEKMAADASSAMDHTLDTRAARINRRTLDQIRSGEALRRYMTGALAAAIALTALLYGLYRSAKVRERRALDRIKRMAHHDDLTGLPNRALLNDRMDQEFARAHRSEKGFAVLLFDLDGFKAVNDTCGHAAGDGVLKAAAERARGCMRASDTVGRIGGDEFLAILPETSLEGAQLVAEKLRLSLGEPYGNYSGCGRVTASVGIGLYPENGTDIEELLRAADRALYASKRSGKDRVSAAGEAA